MVFRTVLPILVILNAIPESSSVCTPATIGQRKCFKMNGFDDLQWTTCVTKEYLSEKSQGKKSCPFQDEQCYYGCQSELFGMEKGSVSDHCRCSTINNPPRPKLSDTCYSPQVGSCDWDDECLSKYQKCDDNKYVFDAHKYTKTLCELQNNYEINSKITKKAHEWIVSTSKCIQLTSMDILRLSTVPTCDEIHSMQVRNFECCYSGHRSVVGAQKCGGTKTHSSMCSLAWKDMWLIIFELSETLQPAVYHISLDLFFSWVEKTCDVEKFYAFATKVKIELAVADRLFGVKDSIANKIGYDLIDDLNAIEKEQNPDLINTITFFPFIFDETRQDIFSVEILFFDKSNIDAAVPSDRSYDRVNKITDRFLLHFKNHVLKLDDTYLKRSLNLVKASQCATMECKSIFKTIEYNPPTTTTTTTTTKPKCCAGTLIWSSPSAVFALTIFVILANFF